MNQLTTYEPICFNNYSKDEIINYAALVSKSDNPSPINKAILNSLKDKTILNRYQISNIKPFDSKNKRTEITINNNGQVLSVAVGATEVINQLTNNDSATKLKDSVNSLAAKGYRSLAVAIRNNTNSWRLAGIIPIYDPLRPDAVETIDEARSMGIDVKVITGDHKAIASEIVSELKLNSNVIDANQLEAAATTGSSQELTNLVESASGFAEVFPEQKFNILKVLQANHHIVGMTGDGVNDAAALKEADCGIAVYGATDAAKSAASIVLLTPGLKVIIDAIKQSRIIFARMNSYAMYRIAETIRILIFMTLSIIVFNFYPVTPIMIILIALMNDSAIITIAYDNMKSSSHPDAWNMKRVLTIATVLGLTGVVSTFSLLLIGNYFFHFNSSQLQTLIYLKLSVAGHLTIFLTRTKGPFYSTRPNKLLIYAVIGTQLIATIIAVTGFMMQPLNITTALFVWLYAIIWFLINDRIKLLAYKLLDKH